MHTMLTRMGRLAIGLAASLIGPAAMALGHGVTAAGAEPALRETVDTLCVGEVSLVYGEMGHGRPVVLLHGNGGSHADLDSLACALARVGYHVYALDSRGQGANPPVAEYHYRDMADDVYAFIRRKGLGRPAVYGWSDGGNVALQMEVMHPGTCALVVTSGANIFPAGWGGEEHIRQLRRQDPNPPPLRRMLYYEPTMTWADMRAVTCPVLVTAGAHDVILPSHTQSLADSLPRGSLRIVDGATHTSYVKHSPQIARIVLAYLAQCGYYPTGAIGQSPDELVRALGIGEERK